MKKQWWHNKVAYQIYPKSFKDSNGDGIGDIPGIIQKLDYLKELGIDIIWVSPVYQSPMVDQGYDISDYYAIDSRFGTMEDMECLIAEAKKRDMHIVMDLVVNHCSDKHEWFIKAMQEPEGKYGKYFYIKEGEDGNPPNNWRADFGGSCWEKMPGYENKFYYHTFAKEQPDLNWENPEVREEIYRMINWWFEKGIAGFRLDAITNIKKLLTWESLPADAADGMAGVGRTVRLAKGIGEFLNELKARCFVPHNAFTVGEVWNIDITSESIEEYIGENGYFSTMFEFEHTSTTMNGTSWCDNTPFEFRKWRDVVLNNQVFIKDIAYEANIIENHDKPRGASTFIPEEDYSFESVTALATLSMMLRGIPFIYQGQEIGMRNCRFPSVEAYDDVSTKDQYMRAMEKGFSEAEALESCYRQSRDNARTPMQWSAEENAGFTEGTPWLPINPNYQKINVAANEAGDKTILNFYKTLIEFRKNLKNEDILITGSLEPAYTTEEHAFAYYRVSEDGKKRWLVFSNFQNKEQTYKITEEFSRVLLNNYSELHKFSEGYKFLPYQTVILEL